MGDSKTSKDNLSRIRDNQRRSRARRKEYVQELEAKHLACEQLGIEASAEVRAAAHKVLDENKRLRALLRQWGVDDAEVRAYLNDSADELPLQSATASLDGIIDRRIPFTGETSESTRDWNPHDSQGTIQEVASRMAGGCQVPQHQEQNSATPKSLQSNAVPMSTNGAHSTNSEFSAPPHEHQCNLTPDMARLLSSSYCKDDCIFTPEMQWLLCGQSTAPSSPNLISSAQSEYPHYL